MNVLRKQKTMPSLPQWLSASNVCYTLIAFLLSTTGVSATTPAVAETVYLKKEAALTAVLGEAVTIRPIEQEISTADAQALSNRLGRKISPGSHTFYFSQSPAQTVTSQSNFPGFNWDAVALIMDEVGKYYPITHVVAIRSDGTVKDVRVMVYRESIGHQVRKKRFLKQFFNKTSRDNLQVDRTIHGITGATMSSWSVTEGVRRALAYTDYFVFNR